MKKMINVKVEKVGVSFQGGLYPENLVEQVVAKFVAEGYKIVKVG